MSLKPWYKVVTPREDFRDGKPLDAAEFAVHSDDVRNNRAPLDYQKSDRYFALHSSSTDEDRWVYDVPTRMKGLGFYMAIHFYLLPSTFCLSLWRCVEGVLARKKGLGIGPRPD